MKFTNWIVVFCFLLGSFPVGAFSGTSPAGEIQRIQAKGELVVSLNKDYPPFSMIVDGQLQGLDVDLSALLAESLGVRVKFIRPATYDLQIPTLVSGKSDIIIAAMTRTIDRGLTVNFTDPYFEVSQAALVQRDLARPGADSYFDLLDVDNLLLGVKADTTHERFARQLFADSAIRLYPTADGAAKALVKGEVTAMAADSPFIRVWKESHPEHYLKIKSLLAPVTKEYYAFAVRKGDLEFLNWLNLFISQIKIDGTLDILVHEYFERMPWLGRDKEKTKPNRAIFLKNRFIQNKKDNIEKRRHDLKGDIITYD